MGGSFRAHKFYMLLLVPLPPFLEAAAPSLLKALTCVLCLATGLLKYNTFRGT